MKIRLKPTVDIKKIVSSIDFYESHGWKFAGIKFYPGQAIILCFQI